jgi:1-acyl-sn-glycerol-3-phosphate acyltransferase
MPSRNTMTVDGFRTNDAEAFTSFSPEVAQRVFAALEALGRRLDVHVDGLEHVPAGRGLLVANHAFGFDVILPVAAIAQRLNRRVWMLGEHLWWRMPFVRRFVTAIGVVDGTQENIDRLLAAGELVLVLPGGMREALKPRELRYQLLWGQRYGFVRAAIRNQAPILPLACVGADELFHLVGNSFRRGARWLGKTGLPLPRPAHFLPIVHRVQLCYRLGEPIAPPAPYCVDDAVLVRRMRREVEGALHELIEDELSRRLGLAAH